MNAYENELTALCEAAREMTADGHYDRCQEMLATAMARHPDAPEPHNLLGVVLQQLGEHARAMKHFRAAYALDPSYEPARLNLECFGSIANRGEAAWQASEAQPAQKATEEEYKDWNLGRFFRKILCA